MTFFVVVAAMVVLAQSTALAEQSPSNKDELAYAGGKTFVWDGGLFENPPSKYNKDLAVAAAHMCNEAQGTDGSKIKQLLKRDCGFVDVDARNYYRSSAYCIGHDVLSINGTDTTVLVVVARGSTTWDEFVGDATKGGRQDFKPLGERVWDNVYDFEEMLWGETKQYDKGIGKYLDEHPEVEQSKHIKILVTGHSLGGAAANMVAARMTTLLRRGEWLADKISPDDIYCYTFGAINVLSDKEESIEEGFENIHNIYNLYDSFGPKGNWGLGGTISSPNSKWGHADMFEHKYDESGKSCNNHDMGNYLNCVRGTCDNHCEIRCKADASERIVLGGYSFSLPDYWKGKVDVAYDKPHKFFCADENATVCIKGTDYAILCMSHKGDNNGKTWSSPAAWAEGASRIDATAGGSQAWVGLDGGGAIGVFAPSKWFSISRLDGGGYNDSGSGGYDSQEVSDQVNDLQKLGTNATQEELMRKIMATAQPE